MISEKTLSRIIVYERILSGSDKLVEGSEFVHSHDLARATGGTSAQVRRDLMEIGFSGNTTRGYRSTELVAHINRFLAPEEPQLVAVVGMGHLGRAIMNFFSSRGGNQRLVAGFDRDPHKTGRVIQGCRCYHSNQMEEICRNLGVTLAVITVPAEAAQEVAEHLAAAGVRGMLNFTPIPLRVPVGVFVESIDLTTALEKVAFLSGADKENNSELDC